MIIAVPGFGDVLFCTPLIRAVRTRWPDAELHVLVRGKVSGVLEGNDDVDEIIEVPRRASLRVSRSILRGRFRYYDLVLSNSASDRMAIYSLFLGRRRISIVPERGNNATLKRWAYHAHVNGVDDSWHNLPHVNQLGELVGLKPGTRIVNPRSPGSHEAVAKHLGAGWDQRPFAVVHPGASLPEKQWHATGWRAVVDYLNGTGLRVVVTGGPGEAERAYVLDELGLDTAAVTQLVGELRLGDISELVAKCTLYIGVDTLVSHIAAAAGAPTVVIFGPSNPMNWGPWPLGHDSPHGPYHGQGSQQIGNVYLVRHADERLENLGEEDVLKAIGTMLETAGGREQS